MAKKSSSLKLDAEIIASLRLKNQCITQQHFGKPEQVIDYMGAIQAQDFSMSKWAIGLRMKNGKESAVDAALDSGKLIRTHLLRPTWHIASASDIYWMLELSKPQIGSQVKNQHKNLEISSAIIKKSCAVFEKALIGGKCMNREELRPLLAQKGIATDLNRMSHLLFAAEIEGLLCSGPTKNQKTTYALLEERVPKKNRLEHSEALYTLAKKYFISRGPATLQDFIWWSGLKISDAKKALESVRSEFSAIKKDDTEYFFDPESAAKIFDLDSFHLLPAYDEFMIAYKDRKAVLPSPMNSNVISSNGIFWPIMVNKGKVCGLWKRSPSGKKTTIEGTILDPKNAVDKKTFSQSAIRFSDFLEKNADISLVKKTK